MNIINFQFASNYTNIIVYGYLYNKRNESASYTETKRKEKKLIINYNIILYYIIFNKYIEYFKKNKKYIKEELKFILKYFFFIEEFEDKKFFNKIKKLFSNKNQKSIEKIVNKLRAIKNCIK